ncbi:MAG: carboxy terminal-processing peptidase [Bacteroidia bacterium]|nr:carboxy terminal-processing peptidase [Bacteroidia bacterium]
MKLKLLITGAVVSALFMFSSYTFYKEDGDKPGVLIRLMMQGMEYYHYQPPQINDDFSQHVFDLYLKNLDYSKRFLTQRDVNNLRKYREKIDEELKEGSFEFFDMAAGLFDQRVLEAKGYTEEILAKPFDFTQKEYLEADYEKLDFAENEAALKDRWRKTLKYQTLSRLVTLMENQEKSVANSGQEGIETKSFATLEEEARLKVLKTQEQVFHRLERIPLSDRRADFINSVANVYDPYTGYFPPKDKEDFDMDISGKMEGIGAQLRETDGFIKVVSIVPGSASARQGKLEVNDVILKVAQADQDPVDVVDMDIDEAIKMIRGKKGTEVRLTVRKVDGSEVIIPIVRDVVILEETYAKSAVLQSDKGKKNVGYIYLPKFYVDFDDPRGRHCSEDIALEIEKLKKDNIKGLIIDLRNNGGGSLPDVIDMAGLFINKGPVVQVKARGGAPQVKADKDPAVQWDGPLVILVNSLSASASEILAAAVQDYDRGIIVGTTTFGKGTVQSFFSLDNMVQGASDLKPLGDMKLTTQKFYRINGGATQHKGVIPDIVLPDEYSFVEYGERDQDFSMPWDEISPVPYQKWTSPVSQQMDQLKKASEKRVAESETFSLVKENAERLKQNQELERYPLNMEEFRAERKRLDEEAARYKDLKKPIQEMVVTYATADVSFISQDTVRANRFKSFQENLTKDPYVFESLNIIKDMQ